MSGDVTNLGLENLKGQGLDIYAPVENEIQIDLDTQSAKDGFETRRAFFERVCCNEEFYFTNVIRTRSKSGKGWHVRIFLNEPINEVQRLMIQAMLGSDWKREILGLRRLTIDIHPVGVLAELPALRAVFGPEGILPSPELSPDTEQEPAPEARYAFPLDRA